MTDSSPSLPRSPRRFRFGLRTLFVVVMLVACGVWFFARQPVAVIGNLSRGSVDSILEAVDSNAKERSDEIMAITKIEDFQDPG